MINQFLNGQILDAFSLNQLVDAINQHEDKLTGQRLLQVQEYKVPSLNDTYISIPSGDKYITPIEITITPKSATSKLYIEATVQYRIVAALGMSAGLQRDGVDIPGCYNVSGVQSFFYKGSSVNHHYNPMVNASVISGNTNPTTFRLFLIPYADVGEFNYGWGRNSIKITEIGE